MARVILHIGTHKTATTTVQNIFHHNSEKLAACKVAYPKLGTITAHHALVGDWTPLPPAYRLPEGSRAALNKIVHDYANTDMTVFLSTEEFSRCGQGRVDLAEIRQILSPFDRIEIICTLRTQWQFIQSAYLEISKRRLPERPPELVKKAINNGVIDGLWVDYNKLLDELEKVFDPFEITFVDYTESCKSEGGIVGTYLRYLDIPISADDLTPLEHGNANVSPEPLANWAANTLANPKVTPPWLIRMATTALKGTFGDYEKSTIFSAGEINAMEKHFRPLNEKLVSRRAPVQPGFRLSNASLGENTISRNMLNGHFWVRLSRALFQDRIDG